MKTVFDWKVWGVTIDSVRYRIESDRNEPRHQVFRYEQTKHRLGDRSIGWVSRSKKGVYSKDRSVPESVLAAIIAHEHVGDLK